MADSLFDCCNVDGIRHCRWRLAQKLSDTPRLSSAEKCVAGLRALEATIAASDLPTANALETFRRISEEHAACLA
jgi:hypothetical protein